MKSPAIPPRPSVPQPGPPPQVKAAAVLRNRAVTLLQAGQAAEAEALLKEATRIFPGFAEAEIRIGNIRRERGDAEAAIKRYRRALAIKPDYAWAHLELAIRSEEHTSELQSLMRISYAVFCLKKKNNQMTLTSSYRNTLSRTSYYTH